MQFPIQLDILDFIFKGLLIGIIASAPMGPVGILCIQRTLNKGRWYGFITGIGAAVSDTIYALIVGLGMSFIMGPLQNPTYKLILQMTPKTAFVPPKSKPITNGFSKPVTTGFCSVTSI